MPTKMILAADQGNAIGWSDGRLAYPSLKKDMARFKALTTGGTVLMGRKTFDSLNRPGGLPNRTNIVVTSGFHHPTMADHVKRQVHQYIEATLTDHRDPDGRDLWVIGGSMVYERAIDSGLVDEIHLTLVHSSCGADVVLRHDLAAWKRFVLQQRKLGINWDVEPLSREWDGDVETSYIVFKRIA